MAYDEVGRPVNHKIRGGQETMHRNRRYEWDVNYRLKKVTNELTKGSVVYSYDRFSNLVSVKGTEILSVFRTFDEVGNVYGTEDRSDRIYGAGSRLETSGIDLKEKRNTFQGGYGKLVTKGTEYCYDEEGNLARMRSADGSTWEYSYYGNGMLRKVVRPDKSVVIFKYDALGRRIEKCITKAGSENVISFAEKKALAEESKWETIGGVRIRRPNVELQKPHVVKGNSQSVYEGEVFASTTTQNQVCMVEKVIRFLWDGNTILHEWEDNANSSKKPRQKIDYQADYVVKLSEQKKAEEKSKAAKGEPAPESFITWIYQDDFIPRAKITQDGCYSIMTDYLGTPVEAYDDAGNLVWERELDINGKVMPVGKDTYGRTMKEVGEKTFIPFRFQGQYEDEETGLYYNRFRYYDPETGQYTQQDPIGLAGGNPTLYGYVGNTNWWIDPFGLDVRNGVGRIHVTYRGIKNGLPYTGYASAPSSLNLSAQEIINRRYGNNFDLFGGKAPTPVYEGKDQMGKWTTRGLEQRYYELDLADVGGDTSKVANRQNPVGINNANRDNYLKAADAELNKTKTNSYLCK